MNTLVTQDFLSEIRNGLPIPAGKLAYFQGRLSGLVNQALLKVFGVQEREKDISRRELALRIGRKPEQITRWFSYPCNLTLDTVSDLFVGMGCEVQGIVLVNLTTGAKMQYPFMPKEGRAFGAPEHAETVRSAAVEIFDDQRPRNVVFGSFGTSQENRKDRHTIMPPPSLGTAASNQLQSGQRSYGGQML